MTALAWILADEARAARFLALTGLTPESLRGGLDQPPVLAAVLEFLAAHEPDLIAAAEAVGVAPAQLTAAAGRLGA